MRRAAPVLVAALLPVAAPAPPADDPVKSVEVVTVREGRGGGTTWFHRRGCTLPDGMALWTPQEVTGSDVFGPVHWTASRDGGSRLMEDVGGITVKVCRAGTELD